MSELALSVPRSRSALVPALAIALVGAMALALSRGAMPVSLREQAEIFGEAALGGGSVDAVKRGVLLDIRLPRALFSAVIGAALGCAGALSQALFRNPLADPSLIGASAGAALAAASCIVLAGTFVVAAPLVLLPVSAFGGALAASYAVWRAATVRGRSNIAAVLLAGVAITAICMAGTGVLTLVASDAQLRSLTFWTMGSLAGGSWATLAVAALFTAPVVLAAPALAQPLDAWLLGEAESFHLGVDVDRLKRRVVLLVAVAVGTAVALAGVINFVGLVVPHLVRLVSGPSHRRLLPASALGGALLLTVGDVVARTVAVPAEVPIGIVTALAGAPWFLWLLRQRAAEAAL
jgi:iron complex transport system permease protein